MISKVIIYSIILTGCFVSATAQNVRLKRSSGKIIPETELLIPLKENRFVYEKYSWFKSVYWKLSEDTLVLENDTLRGKKTVTFVNLFEQTSDICSPEINKIRNGASLHNMIAFTDAIAKDKIGYNNQELSEFEREAGRISQEEVDTLCRDAFLTLLSERKESIINKINEIYDRKKQRKDWFLNNHDKINKEVIRKFLKTFDENESDKYAFLEIVLVAPEDLITEINKQEQPYLAYWKLDDLPIYENMGKVIESLKQSRIKDKTYRNIMKRLKRNLIKE